MARSIDNQIAKTLAYLSSPEGKSDWKMNESRGYGHRACLMAAVQSATGYIKPEEIQVIERGVMAAWIRGNCGRVA